MSASFTVDRRWATIMTVMSSPSSAIVLAMRASVSLSRALVASSRTRILGSRYSARAIPTR